MAQVVLREAASTMPFLKSYVWTKMRGVLSIFMTATAMVGESVHADCPDYSLYSQDRHMPFSTGKYNLSYMRPDSACRTFNSSIVEDTISSMKGIIKDPDLFRLFENSFPSVSPFSSVPLYFAKNLTEIFKVILWTQL